MDSKVPLASPAPLPANSSTEIEASSHLAVSCEEEGMEWPGHGCEALLAGSSRG